MKKYLIIQNYNTEFPNLKTDLYGKPLVFTTKDEALTYIDIDEQVIEITI